MEGQTYNLKAGKALNILDVISGNKTVMRNKFIHKYFSKAPSKNSDQYARDELNRTKIGQFQFYLNKGNVVVCVGPYQRSRGNEESKDVLKGNYQ